MRRWSTEYGTSVESSTPIQAFAGFWFGRGNLWFQKICRCRIGKQMPWLLPTIGIQIQGTTAFSLFARAPATTIRESVVPMPTLPAIRATIQFLERQDTQCGHGLVVFL